MRFLIVVGRDGPNLFIENIVREINRRGHEIDMFAVFMDDNSIRMFFDMGLQIKPMESMTEKVVKKADCIFCPVQVLDRVWEKDKYIFSFCNMNPKFDEVRGADFVFTLSDVGERNIKTYASMPVGLPKNDTDSSVAVKQEKRILVIDSGHFPFAKKGKEQVAEMILNIARSFPDYEVCVKPRWLKGCDPQAMTHANATHLYDLIADQCKHQLPSNLKLLMEHKDLQQLIDSSESVVTLCTTAYLDVALRGKGLLVARGVENEDMYQVRADYFDRVYNYAEGSGCVVDYRDVCNYLPSGKKCRPEHVKETFTYMDDVSKRVVEVMEYVFGEFIAKGKYVAIEDYSYETYQKDMRADSDLNLELLKGNRMYVLAGSVIALCRSISVKIDWEPFLRYQYELCNKAAKGIVGFTVMKRILKKAKYNYLIENADALMDNDLDRVYLYEALFTSGKYDELLDFRSKEGFGNCGFNYFCGVIYYNRKNYRGAETYLEKYVDEVISRPYQKYLVERNAYKRNGVLLLMECYIQNHKVERLEELLDTCLQQGYLEEINKPMAVTLDKVLPIFKEYRKASELHDDRRMKKLYADLKSWHRTMQRKEKGKGVVRFVKKVKNKLTNK